MRVTIHDNDKIFEIEAPDRAELSHSSDGLDFLRYDWGGQRQILPFFVVRHFAERGERGLKLIKVREAE